MTTLNKILAGTLVVQVALGAFMWMPEAETQTETHALASIDADTVTRIEIVGRTSPTDEEAPTPVVLEKDGVHWKIASEKGYPAKADSVDKVLETLGELQGRSPIATTAASHANLEVADTQFTRRVKVTAGGTDTELFLGAASGQAANVRLAGTDDVYQVRGASAWGIGDSSRRFWEPSYVKVDKDDIDSMAIRNAQGAHSFARAEGAWSLPEGAPEGASVDGKELDSLAGMLLNVRLAEVVGTEVLPAFGLSDGARVEWTITENEQTTTFGYSVGAVVDTHRYVKADHLDFVVKVLDSGVKRAAETDFAFVTLDGEDAPE